MEACHEGIKYIQICKQNSNTSTVVPATTSYFYPNINPLQTGASNQMLLHYPSRYPPPNTSVDAKC